MEMTIQYILEFDIDCGLSVIKKYLDTDVKEVYLIEYLEISDELEKDINSWLSSVKCIYDFKYVVNNENLTRLADLQGKYLARELFWNLICKQDIREENCEDEYRLRYYYRNFFDNELVWVLDWRDDEEVSMFSGRCSLLY